MARRNGQKRKVRRTKTFYFLSALEAYAYADILTRGTFGNSPYGFISGGMGSVGTLGAGYSTGNGVSLSSLLQDPQTSLATAAQNAQKNLVPKAINSFLVGASFRVAKALLRRPLSSVNRNIMTPMFGKTVKV